MTVIARCFVDWSEESNVPPSGYVERCRTNTDSQVLLEVRESLIDIKNRYISADICIRAISAFGDWCKSDVPVLVWLSNWTSISSFFLCAWTSAIMAEDGTMVFNLYINSTVNLLNQHRTVTDKFQTDELIKIGMNPWNDKCIYCSLI